MGKRILFFESDRAFASHVRSALESRDATVHLVEDGSSGLDEATTLRPDLILLTIELPRMNGFLVCKKLKKNPETQGIPVVILSSEATEEIFEQHRKLRTRAEDYVRKPVEVSELVERVGALVALAPAPSEGPDDIEIAIDEGDVFDASDAGSVDDEIDAFAESAFDALMLEGPEAEAAARDATPETMGAPPPGLGNPASDPGNRIELAATLPPVGQLPSEVQVEQQEVAPSAALVDRSDDELDEVERGDVELDELDEAVVYSLAPEDLATPDERSDELDGQTDHPPYDESVEPIEPIAIASPAVPDMVALEDIPNAAPTAAPDGDEPLPLVAVSSVADGDQTGEQSIEGLQGIDGLQGIEELRAGGLLGDENLLLEAEERRPASSPANVGQSPETEAEVEALRAELEDTRVRLRDADGFAEENRRLRTELESARSQDGRGVSNREFLDLREALNAKDRENLALRDQVSDRDKQLIELRDRNLQLERGRADQEDHILALERRKVAADDANKALTARTDELERRSASLDQSLRDSRAKVAQLESELRAEREELTRLDREHHEAVNALRGQLRDAEASKAAGEAALTAATEAHEAQTAELRSEHERDVAKLQREHEDAVKTQLEAAEAAQASALAAQAETLRAEAQAARASALAAQADTLRAEAERSESRALDEQRAALEEAGELARGELRDQLESQLARTKHAHEQELAALGRKLAETEAELASSREEGSALRRTEGHLRRTIADADLRIEGLERRAETAEAKIRADEELLVRARRAFAIGLSLLEQQENRPVAVADREGASMEQPSSS